jgi:hypothetical protein
MTRGMSTKADGLVLLRLASQVEDLRTRVAQLEDAQRTNTATIHRHGEALEVIRGVLNGDGEDAEGTMLQ